MSTLSLQRSKRFLENKGYCVGITEHWNAYAHIRQDLFSMCDLLAIRPDVNGVTGIQACGEDVQPHIKKLLEGYTDVKGVTHGPNKCLPIWKAAGNKFLIHSWVKRGARDKRKLWQLREVEL